jgi:alcohol dehydrogenase
MAKTAVLPPIMRGFYVDQNIRDSTVKGMIRDDLTTPHVDTEPAGVVVKVLAAAVSSDALRFVRGQYLAHLGSFPSIAGTGAIGIVYGIGKDVVTTASGESLRIGELVLCTCYIGDETNGILKGLIHFGTEASKKVQKRWREGSWAEFALFPADNVYPIRGSFVSTLRPSLLARVERTTISYSALKCGGFKAGQIVAIGGGNGTLGSGCLSLALALGASKIYALGRRTQALESLKKALGPNAERRVVNLALDSIASDDEFVAKCQEAFKVHGAPHLYLDALGVTPSTLLTTLGLRALRPGGTAVLFGGVRGELQIPYGDLVTRRITLTGCFM